MTRRDRPRRRAADGPGPARRASAGRAACGIATDAGTLPRRAAACRRRLQDPGRLHAPRRPRSRRGDPRPRRAAEGHAGRAHLGDRVRRRRQRDPLHARPAHEGRRARGRVAGHLRARGVLQRDQADAQRAAGRARGPHRRAVGHVAQLQRDERARARPAAGTSCLVHDPQPAALYHLVPEKAHGWVWRCHIDMSSPNPSTIARLLPYICDYPQVALPHAESYVPRGDERQRQRRAAGDRPARAEEHGAVARGRVLRLPAVRHRRRPPDDRPRSRASTRGRIRSA